MSLILLCFLYVMSFFCSSLPFSFVLNTHFLYIFTRVISFFFFFVIFLEVTLSVKINVLTDKNLGQINSSLIAVIYKIFASVYLILPSVLHAVIIWKLYISV